MTTRSEQIREALDAGEEHSMVHTLDSQVVIVRNAAREYADVLDAATEPDYEAAQDRSYQVFHLNVLIETRQLAEVNKALSKATEAAVHAAVEGRLIDRREH